MERTNECTESLQKKRSTEGEIIPPDHFEEGMKALSKKDFDAAKGFFNEALIEGNTHYLCYYYLGLTQYHTYDSFSTVNTMLENALVNATQASEKLQVLTKHIEICYKAGKTGKAKGLLRKAIRIASNLEDPQALISILQTCQLQALADIRDQEPDWDTISDSIDFFIKAYKKGNLKQQELGQSWLNEILSLSRQFANKKLEHGEVVIALNVYKKNVSICIDLFLGLYAQLNENPLPQPLWSALWVNIATQFLMICWQLKMVLDKQENGIKNTFNELSNFINEAKVVINRSKLTFIKAAELQNNPVTLPLIELLIKITEPNDAQQQILTGTQSITIFNDMLNEFDDPSLNGAMNLAQNFVENTMKRVLANSSSPVAESMLVNSNDMVIINTEIYLDIIIHKLLAKSMQIHELMSAEKDEQDNKALSQALEDSKTHMDQINDDIHTYKNYLDKIKPNQKNTAERKTLAEKEVTFCVYALDVLIQHSNFAISQRDFASAKTLDNQMHEILQRLSENVEKENNRSLFTYQNKIKEQYENLSIAIIRSLNDKHNLDPLTLNYYGKKGQPEPHTFPSADLERAIKFIRAGYPSLPHSLNLSVHCITVIYKAKYSKKVEKPISIPFCASIELPNKKIQVITIDELKKPNDSQNNQKDWQFAQDAILDRIQAGWDLAKTHEKGNRPKKFDTRHHKHSEQVFYSLLEQLDPEKLCEQLTVKTNGEFQPGAKIQFIALDSFSERTSCYHCRLGALTEMSTTTSYGSFAKKMQTYLLDEKKYRVSGSKHDRPKLKMVSRVLAFIDYSNSDTNNGNPAHKNPDEKNVKKLNNLGIFQSAIPSVFASGGRHRLRSLGRK